MWTATQGLREEIKADVEAPFDALAPQMFAAGSLFLSAAQELGAPPGVILNGIARYLGAAPPSTEALN